ncbi:hypothetical protein IDJ77_11965 [Mucilaginibacter sp. ZT4R22]|uniref:Uncharacterized protein n=1 Tax=Mucilaginibacter pankratovii TaxID=2772110 RepID=A0ABR7WQC5_9SPHI|nr:hypothetical protein [Mucilaginibacter pankratovii]MBD1364526.1 hypothetical protein [Mucilaginibacter pankratovii]
MGEGLSLLKKKIEDLFGEEPLNEVDEELFKWLMFAYLDKGSGMKDLDGLNFELFKEKLTLLVDAIYKLHQERTGLEKL